jgi:hypothetical protein
MRKPDFFCQAHMVYGRKEVSVLATVTLKEGESQDSLLKRFRKEVMQAMVHLSQRDAADPEAACYPSCPAPAATAGGTTEIRIVTVAKGGPFGQRNQG